jgi:hypothetical protein
MRLYPVEPVISVNEAQAEPSYRWVLVVWGGGGGGSWGFFVGPTNFAWSRGHLWGPGVYYFGRGE